jgi:PKD repeat protein
MSVLAQTSDEFTVIALPDTQYYSANYPEIFRSQTEWIADNRDALNIRMVIGLGDIVNNGSSLTEWENADAAIRLLDNAGVPYLLAPGNHDYDNSSPPTRSATLFNQYFGPARYSGRPHYLDSYAEASNENFYGSFEISGKTYLVLLLEFYPRDPVLSWAASILEANPDIPVIVATHSYTYFDDSRVGRCDLSNAEAHGVGSGNDGDEMWEKLLKRHSNVFLVLSGHIGQGDGTGRLAELGINGNLVNQVLSNSQNYPQGGGGYLRILRFRPSLNQIDVKTYSPHYGVYKTDAENQFTLQIHKLGDASGPATVRGRVRATDCTALEAATVKVLESTAQTDQSGNYTLATTVGETQTVSAEKSGYQSQNETIELTSGFSTSQDFFLTPITECQPASTTQASVTICTPINGTTVEFPVRVTAAAYSPHTITRTELWVGSVKKYQVAGDRLDTMLEIGSGMHRLTVVAVEPTAALFKSSINIVVEVNVNRPPVASISITRAGCRAPLTVTGSTSASTDPDGTVVGSEINFGDGTVVANATATHTYAQAGTYNVVATVTDDDGASATATTILNLSPSDAICDFAISASQQSVSVIAGQAASFTLSTTRHVSFDKTISLTCSNLPLGAQCSFTPNPLTHSASTATVMISTRGGQSAKLLPTGDRPRVPLFYAFWVTVPALLLIGTTSRSGRTPRLRQFIFFAMLLLCLHSLLSGCGGAGVAPPQNGASLHSGTPPGTYTVVITGTSGDLQRTAPVTLFVTK